MTGRLGKLDYKEDERTAKMATLINRDVQIAASYDFDRHRVPFTTSDFGNQEWGDCVLAGEANDLLRKERKETRKTIPLQDVDVINRYKTMTGSQAPNDAKDQGLIVLDAMNAWRHSGWRLSSDPEKDYTISAFAFLAPDDNWLLRACIYFFSGIHLGFLLPLSASAQTSEGYWDIPTVNDSHAKPNSWGGHLVYAKRYDANNIYVLTWGEEIRVTNAFVKRYADEAWVAIDQLDNWRKSRSPLDVEGMIHRLQGFGVDIQ
jgi:hypothetical protein